MKLGGQQVERFLRQPGVPVVLVYGPDQGLVRERVERLIGARARRPQGPVPAERAQRRRGARRPRPAARRGARAVPGRRPAGGAGAPGERSGDRRLPGAARARAARGAGRDRRRRARPGLLAAAADRGRRQCRRDRLLPRRGPRPRRPDRRGCWPSTSSTIEPEARAYLVEHLGADRGVTRSELAKLALYLDDEPARRPPARRRVTLEAAAQVVGDSAALDLDDLVHAATLGEAVQVERCLDRLLGEGQSPVRLLRALANHVGRLHQLACRVEARRGDRAGDRAGAAADPLPAQGERQGRAAALAGGAGGARAERAARGRDRLQDHRLAGGGAVPARGAPPLPGGPSRGAQLDLTGPANRTSCIAGERLYALLLRDPGEEVARDPGGQRDGSGEGAACCATWCIGS